MPKYKFFSRYPNTAPTLQILTMFCSSVNDFLVTSPYIFLITFIYPESPTMSYVLAVFIKHRI